MTSQVSCLCVTENRAAFMPWLLWAFDRQSWQSKELIIVDSSTAVFQTNRRDVRVITSSPGTSVPAKRNLALAAATGDLIAWFDDDDWQHPERLKLLVDALPGKAPFAGATRSWFVDLHTGRCRPYDGHGNIIFNSAIFRRELVQGIRFDEHRRKASDTIWMRSIMSRCGRGAAVRAKNLMLWLSHDSNISNPRGSRAFSDEIASIKQQLGDEAWGDTDRELERLRSKLGPPGQATPWAHPLRSTTFPELADGAERRVHRLRQAGRRGLERIVRRPELDGAAWDEAFPGVVAGPGDPNTPNGTPQPAVSSARMNRPRARRPATPNAEVALIVRLGSADQPPLERLITHMIRQARCPVVEKLAFGGTSLIEGIDRIVDPAEGAGCAALRSALGSVTAPYVLVVYAPLVFHVTRGSWVAEAIDRLERDPTLLLVTNQCGAAAGPAGSPRNRPKAKGPARWDGHLQLWRRQKIASPAFVAARERLAEALAAVPAPIAHDLEQGLTAALRAKSADCGSLAGNDGWALRVEGQMRPATVESVVSLAEADVFPTTLLGKSSLSLDEPWWLAAWQRLALETRDSARPL